MLTVFLSFAAPFCNLVFPALHYYSHLLVVVVLICLVCLPQKFGKEGETVQSKREEGEGGRVAAMPSCLPPVLVLLGFRPFIGTVLVNSVT